MPVLHTPSSWLRTYCPSLGGQFAFLDPVSWQPHQLNADAFSVLEEAALAIEQQQFDTFLADVEAAGGWPPGLEFLVRSLTTLGKERAYTR
jgi:hypothetical protein